MPGELQTTRARRYLLGTLAEEDAAAIEQEYFNDPDALERLTAVEDELIEDYLQNRLTTAEHDQFTRVFLAAPHRRRRVETVRRLISAAAHHAGSGATTQVRWLAAAALILAVTGGVWFAWKYGPAPTVREVPGQAAISPIVPPRTLAVALSPTTVRSSSETPNLVIPAGTEFVTFSLGGENTERVVAGRASLRTVTGSEVWQGSTTIENALPEGVIARVSVPASRLPVDDYVLTLFRTDPAGVQSDQEVYRYGLRIRAR